jgi:ankyrin repeat protein
MDNGLNQQLIVAARHNDAERIVELVAKHANVNAADPCGYTALRWAAQKNFPEVIDALVLAGANINALDMYGTTSLMVAIEHQSIDAVIALLNSPGIDIKKQNAQGETALSYAKKYNLQIMNLKTATLKPVAHSNIQKDSLGNEAKPVAYAFNNVKNLAQPIVSLPKNNGNFLQVPTSLEEHWKKYNFKLKPLAPAAS